MLKKRIGKFACAIGLAALCVAGLSACQSGETKQIAATVNGDPIYEEDVTSYIESFRSSYSLTDEDAWGEYLSEGGYTPATLREAVIGVLESDPLIRQAAKEKNITVDSSEIDSYVNQMKAYYDDDEAWNSALESAGITEQEYRDNIELSLLSQKLQDSFEVTVTDDDVLEIADTYSSYYDGAKRSSHILFTSDSTVDPQEILDKINSGELDFAEAAKQYSQDTGSASNGGDVGWDCLNSFVTEYTDALDGLEKGQISGLVTSDYGTHIIMCTDVFTAPEEVTSLDQFPSDFVETFRETAEDTAKSTAFSDWYSDFKDKAEIVINDMPSGLPYDIDMTKYETDDNTNTSTDNTNSSASNTNTSTDNTNTAATENENTNTNTNTNSSGQ